VPCSCSKPTQSIQSSFGIVLAEPTTPSTTLSALPTPRADHKYKTLPSQPPQPSSCILYQTRSTPAPLPPPSSSHSTTTPSPACLKLSPWRPMAPCPVAGRHLQQAPRKVNFWTFSFQDFLVSPFHRCPDEGNGSENRRRQLGPETETALHKIMTDIPAQSSQQQSADICTST
jgi:hypothetical protein